MNQLPRIYDKLFTATTSDGEQKKATAAAETPTKSVTELTEGCNSDEFAWLITQSPFLNLRVCSTQRCF